MLSTIYFVVAVLIVSAAIFWFFVINAKQTFDLLSKLTMRSSLPSSNELGMEATDLTGVEKAEKENRRLAEKNKKPRRRQC